MVCTETIMTDENRNSGDEIKDSTSLSEVLRLQAVALARMSERMASQQGSEQHSMPAPHQPRQESHLPALAGDPVLSEESLPVLNTFRKFLEAERRRARRRVIWVSVVLGIGFIGVVGVVAWLGRERIAGLKNDLIAASVQADSERRKTEADLRKVAESASATAVALKQDLRRNVLSSHSILSSNLNTKLVGRESEMEQLKEKLSSLEIENAMLASQLKELADTSRQLQENYQAWIQAASAQELAEPVEAIPTGTVEEAKTLPLVIPSAGPGRAVRLRVPMSP
jgi:hypothetical protein